MLRTCERACHTAPVHLTDRERAILDFEAKWWRHKGAKEDVILETFGLDANGYTLVINDLIENPESLEYAPQTVKRLRRRRDEAAHTISARRNLHRAS